MLEKDTPWYESETMKKLRKRLHSLEEKTTIELIEVPVYHIWDDGEEGWVCDIEVDNSLLCEIQKEAQAKYNKEIKDFLDKEMVAAAEEMGVQVDDVDNELFGSEVEE